jgi:histidinol-phosphatase (PHP family)
MVDCHVHSIFSPDSGIKFDEAFKKASSLGLDGVTFTDHYEFECGGFSCDFVKRAINEVRNKLGYSPIEVLSRQTVLNEMKYLASKRRELLNGVRDKFGSKVKMFEGAEVGFHPSVLKEIKDLVEQNDFDFVILSVHAVGMNDLASEEYYQSKTRDEAMELYLKTIYDSVSMSDNFNVIGHIGYMCRYMPYKDKLFRYKDYSDLLDMIFKKLIETGKGIEINTAGLSERYKEVGTTHPNFDSVKRYMELGGEIITIGSDAHNVSRIGENFPLIAQELKSLGAKYTTHFEKRKPTFTRL